jgi:hypothetical protein
LRGLLNPALDRRLARHSVVREALAEGHRKGEAER